jgi:hypothetical protein
MLAGPEIIIEGTIRWALLFATLHPGVAAPRKNDRNGNATPRPDKVSGPGG